MKTIEEILKSRRVVIGEKGADGFYCTITLPLWQGKVICSNGAGWEHISVSPFKRRVVPSWDDMCMIKDIFFHDDEVAIQIHPKKTDYVNNKGNCLHLWRCVYKEMVLPPAILVGIPENMKRSEIDKAIKEAYELAGEKYT